METARSFNNHLPEARNVSDFQEDIRVYHRT